MNRLTCTALALWALTIAGCETSSGNLYFLSAQRVGVEVAASDPTSSGAPKVLIGYESVKGAVNPVKEKDGTLRCKAYSVLAITGVAAAGARDAGLAVSEWFATGKAADILASNPMTPAALSGSRTLTPEVLQAATSQQLARTFEAIAGAESFLSLLDDRTPQQDAILASLDGVRTVVASLEFLEFAADGSRTAYDASGLPAGWGAVLEAREDLSQSIVRAKVRSKDSSITEAKRLAARDASVALQTQLDGLDREVLATDAAQALWRELVEIVSKGGE